MTRALFGLLFYRLQNSEMTDLQLCLEAFISKTSPQQAPISSVPVSNKASLPKFHRSTKRLGPIQQSLAKCARELLSEQQSDIILSNDELELSWKLMSEKAQTVTTVTTPADPSLPQITVSVDTLLYRDFCDIGKQLAVKYQRFFAPSVFMTFMPPIPVDATLAVETVLQIPIQPLFNFILRRASLLQERVCISMYDADCDGYITEPELEKYIGDLAPTFPHLETIDKDFMSFYLCGATRKFFFFLDTTRKDKVKIGDVLLSPCLSEFFELQQPDLSAGLLLSNWFSPYSATKIYSQFVDLDLNRNGMLSASEMCQFAKSRYNSKFVERIFQECQTYGGELDYKNYLDFVLAVNDLNDPSSLAYCMRILDVFGRKDLDEVTIAYYVHPMSVKLQVPLNLNDFMDEMFDMANPKDRRKITLQDMINCGVGGQLVALLIDTQAFTQNQYKD